MRLGIERLDNIYDLTKRLAIYLGSIFQRLDILEKDKTLENNLKGVEKDIEAFKEEIRGEIKTEAKKAAITQRDKQFPEGQNVLGYYAKDNVQILSDNVITAINFNTKTSSDYITPRSAGVGTNYITQAKGTYLITSNIGFNSTDRAVYKFVESSIFIGESAIDNVRHSDSVDRSTTTGTTIALQNNIVVNLNSGDIISIRARQDRRPNASRNVSTTDARSHLRIMYLGSFDFS